MSSVYKSSTLGAIPLSFTGRHLLQSLREAVQDALTAQDYSANGEALSRARGKLAQYMSHLEKRSDPVSALSRVSTADLRAELEQRGQPHKANDGIPRYDGCCSPSASSVLSRQALPAASCDRVRLGREQVHHSVEGPHYG